MKLAVIFTGGTIGSKIDGEFISTSPEQNYELLKDFVSSEVTTFEPFTTLSEQIDGELITELVRCVDERLREDFDGIIITHGTDTLQFSAAALALAFGDSSIPIVFVSSNHVLSDPRSNGRDNLKYALKFIEHKIDGVFVSYKNSDQAPEIHLASRLLPHLPYDDSIRSMGGPFGRFEGESFIRLIRDFARDSYGIFSLNRTSPVLWLKAHVGMTFPEAFGKKAVMIEAYHSGTLPTESPELQEFCKNCRAPLYLVGAKLGEQYESTRLFKELGVRSLERLSPIYTYMKLWVVADNELNYNI